MNETGKYGDLLYAYSLGCLEKEDLADLIEYLDSDGEYSWQELGEYQNITSLFPLILNIEKPGPDLKDKVARKLYRMKSEKSTPKPAVKTEATPPEKIEQEKTPPQQTGLPETELKESAETEDIQAEAAGTELEESTETEEVQAEASETEEAETELADFEEVKSKKTDNILLSSLENYSVSADQTAEEDRKNDLTKNTETAPAAEDEDSRFKEHKIEIENKPGFYHEQKLIKGKKEKKKTNFWLIFAFVLFLVIAAGLFFLYLNISKEVKDYKNGIVSLNQKINSLSSKMNENRDLSNILQTKDIKIINLTGTDLSPDSFGKLIIGTVNMNCILQLSHLPALSGSSTYQLWMNNGGQYVSLGVFNPTKDVEYFHFTLPTQNLGQTDFKLTEEPPSGSGMPGKKVYLTGNLQ